MNALESLERHAVFLWHHAASNPDALRTSWPQVSDIMRGAAVVTDGEAFDTALFLAVFAIYRMLED
ncbi:MAG: hypothetical protein ACYCVW_16570 [Rhodocyclaceae bacterium]